MDDTVNNEQSGKRTGNRTRVSTRSTHGIPPTRLGMPPPTVSQRDYDVPPVGDLLFLGASEPVFEGRPAVLRVERPATPPLVETPTTVPPSELEEDDKFDSWSMVSYSHTSSVKSAKSGSSKASSKRRAKRSIEITAAEQLATIELQKLKIKEDLLKKTTEFQLQEADEDSDDSQRLSDDEYEGFPANVNQKRVKKPMCSVPVASAPADGITQLAEAITQAIGKVNTPAKNTSAMARMKIGKEKIPAFEGNPMEWPAFISQFAETTKECEYSDAENVVRLRNCLRGEARDCVQALLVSPNNVSKILEILKLNFGRPRMIVKSLIEKAKKIPPVCHSRPEEILKFSNVVSNLVESIKTMECKQHLQNPQLLDELSEKLPFFFKFQWMEKVKNDDNSTLEDFSTWLTSVAETASLLKDRLPVLGEKKKKDHSFVMKDAKPCYCCGEPGHWMSSCEKFQSITVDERWKMVTEKRICYSCLIPGHMSMQCRKKKACGKHGCTKVHHKLLHKDAVANEEEQDENERNHAIGSNKCVSLLPIIPVILSNGNKEVQVFALLDEGSTATLMDKSLVDELELVGTKDPLSLQLVQDSKSEDQNSIRVSFNIRGSYEEARSFKISGARTVKNIGITPQTLDFEKMSFDYKYLEGLPVDSYQHARPKLIIGQADKLLTLARRYLHGNKNNPVAYKTWLGWVVCGRHPKDSEDLNASYIIQDSTADEVLHQLVKESFSTESFGVSIKAESMRCKDDQNAMEIMEKTTEKRAGAFQTGLLWRDDKVVFPESYQNAFFRLRCQERKMDKDPQFAKLYEEKIAEYIQKGYIQKLNEDEIKAGGSRPWYLPHFGVYNANKPGKIRLVFDAAAKSKGVSLNDSLLQGPDLLNPLPSVLMRFRRKKIGFSADITDMFHRVRIRQEDLPAQRFLWRGSDRSGKPDVYQMNVMLFGATCSPSSALYVIRKNAMEHMGKFPEASKAIEDQFYMDDYLDSADTEENASKLIEDVIHVNSNGNFKLCKWISSSREVMEKIPMDLRAEGIKDMNLSENELPVGRALGIWWNAEEDIFTFQVAFHKVSPEIIGGMKTPTKREVLRLVMSIFDPLGFLAHFIVKAKILLQDIWRSGVGWDEKIPDNLQKKWINWLEQLPRITDMKIPRCYSHFLPNAETTQLHVFCDASEKAYATVAYIRVQSGPHVGVNIVAARTRVASLKPMSIPRLELQAAVMGSRLGKAVVENLDLKFDSVWYWTDSKTVLLWIQSEARRFKQFIAHRVGEICENTDVSSWRWVPTGDNVADDATREETWCDLSSSTRWIWGPEFIYKPEEEWPVLKTVGEDVKPTNDELEIRQEFLGATIETETDDLFEVKKFSSMRKLITTTGWILRAAKIWKKTLCEPELALTTNERQKAENYWIRRSQQKDFGEEVRRLQNGQDLLKSSKLRKFSPFLDPNGILRMKSRLQNSTLQRCEKFPIILHGKSDYTFLLIEHYHRLFAHAGRYFVANELRRKYWIIGVVSSVRSVISKCKECIRRNVKPVMPQMGDVPDCKVAAYLRPFTFTGVDCWGPMEVTIGRSRHKRWGMIFTCLTTRAVHLELLSSLSTDSCVMAILRMKSRRGCPKEIFSDNGTNFVGANHEIATAVETWKRDDLNATISKHGIQWKFIPPGAPHMGGSWERLVRSVKTTMKIILKEQAPKEEVLTTVMIEAEGIVNSRPLTQVPVDPDAPSALTPNHFLIGPETCTDLQSIPVPDSLQVPVTDGKYLRKQWLNSQLMANQFWKRWRTEYLPTLARREKWNQVTKPIQVGDCVIIVEPVADRNQWPMGLVHATLPGKDGIIRIVDVKIVKNGGKQNFKIVRRPVSRICLLDMD